MSAIPALRRKMCAAFVLLFAALQGSASAQAPPAQLPAAQPPPANPASANPAPAKLAPAQPAAINPAAHNPAPAKPGPPTLALPAAAVPAQPPKPRGTEKTIPKPGPGANDAGARATSLRANRLSLISLIDRSVVGRERREIGHVIDVLIDAKGQPAAMVVDVGGFMGMGNRRIAIAWERFALAGRKPTDALQIPFSDAQIKAAPAYDGSQQVTVVQGAIEPASKPSLSASRVDLGEDLGPLSNATAPQADSLNPD